MGQPPILVQGGAVLVGRVDLTGYPPPTSVIWAQEPYKSAFNQGFVLPGNSIFQYLFTRLDGSPLFPLALYRYQRADGSAWTEVGGDLVQVSPLIETVAFQQVVVEGIPSIHVRDPFFFLHQAANTDTPHLYDIYLRDTQPVVAGSEYVYLVADYSADHELVRYINLPSVFVP